MQDDEEELLRSVAMQNATKHSACPAAREQGDAPAKEELERRTHALGGPRDDARGAGIDVGRDPGDGCGGNVDRLQPGYVDMWRMPREIMATMGTGGS